ncbi:retrovirus-related pol polyprotein from transposon TNT 1-94 [Tanacetum coccineum]
MASNSTIVNVSQPHIPIFKGDSYEFWSIKMKTLFKSQDLWEFVESGLPEESSDNARQKENIKKDAKAFLDSTALPRKDEIVLLTKLLRRLSNEDVRVALPI